MLHRITPSVVILAGFLSGTAPAIADDRPQSEPATRTIGADRRYLHLPVDPKASVRRVQIALGSKVVRDFDIRLADGPGAFATFLDLAPFRGQILSITATLPPGSKPLDGITLSDQLPDQDRLYAEADRPRFHFTSRRGWLNDPNGLVWLNGKYHLFYQHNPYGWDWGNMHWGHATSPDLVHWTEQPEALYPQRYGDWCFSGSAVVDHANTSGFGADGKPPLVAAYTSTGRGECIISSRDEGQTWTEFAGNPVIRHNGRDPRLFWHGPTKRWIMAVYEEGSGKDRMIAFHSSPDLKAWTEESRIDGFYECPDLFELPVIGSNPPRSLWVLSAADGKYRLGQFDGHKFIPETDKLTLWHGDFYAAQTFSDTPDGRRIQIGWGRDITFPGMPFNQQMTIPCELTLRTTPDGPRLYAEPVAELAKLEVGPRWWQGVGMAPSSNPEPVIDVLKEFPPIEQAEGIDLTVVFTGETPGGLILTWLGSDVRYDGDRHVVQVAGLEVPLQPGPVQFRPGFTPIGQVAPEATRPGPRTAPGAAGPSLIKLRIIGDRRSLEVFGNDGQVAISRHIVPDPKAPALRRRTEKHPSLHRSFELGYALLKSVW